MNAIREIGPYRLDVLLGRGGMGEIYKAWDARLERWVAVKRLIDRGNGDGCARFLREARIVAGLGHPAIVHVYDIVEDDGDDWIVMELVDGPNLATLLRDGPLDVILAADYARQVAEGLAAAHQAGVVHRDLKAENVMVDDRIRILDFGLARRPQDARQTEAGKMVGTPRAMAPEQVLGRRVDARADLFALGVLLYELLTSRSPFFADSIAETTRRVVTHLQPPVRQFNARISPAFSELVDHLLEKDPDHRPQAAVEVAERLADFRDSRDSRPRSGTATETLKEPTIIDGTTLGVPAVEARVRTLLMSELVDSNLELPEHHDRLARDLLAGHGGLEINKTNGFLVLFERPWNAVCYALAYQEALRELAGANAVLEARVGIHLGEVVLLRNSPDDIARGARPLEVEGSAKPTTARLVTLAAGGQILLTRTAFDVARGAAFDVGEKWQWFEHGPYRFQDVEGEIEVCEVKLKNRPGESLGEGVETKGWPAPEVGENEGAPVTLRAWPTPDLPDQPYPVLLPYTHPDLMAGREDELADVCLCLELPIPILGLGAASGTGKSSFLLAGLVPTLRADGKGVAVDRHPQEPGLAGRLLGDLLVGAPSIAEDHWRAFPRHLADVERLSGEPPLLVIDQFEDVLKPSATDARARLGVLLAATVKRRPGIDEPLCRWLLAYRNEFHGAVLAWLEDVLVDVTDDLALPHDLTGPERFQSFALAPLATITAADDPLAEATSLFQAAIEKPLRHYDYRFSPGHAQRLAQAFAEARLARPTAPLVPEFQVVLAHLLTLSDGIVKVPEDAGALVEEALLDHLRRALESAFPAGTEDAATLRARALLALRELATVTGQRDEGIPVDDLARAIGQNGEEILGQLATPLTRLVVFVNSPDGQRCVLSHDRMTEVVVRLVEKVRTPRQTPGRRRAPGLAPLRGAENDALSFAGGQRCGNADSTAPLSRRRGSPPSPPLG